MNLDKEHYEFIVRMLNCSDERQDNETLTEWLERCLKPFVDEKIVLIETDRLEFEKECHDTFIKIIESMRNHQNAMQIAASSFPTDDPIIDKDFAEVGEDK